MRVLFDPRKFGKNKMFFDIGKPIGIFLDFVGPCSGHLFGKLMDIISSKAPGNYSASIWFNNFSIRLWENLKLLISMISGFWTCPRLPKPIILIFIHTRIPKRNQENPCFFL